MKRVIDGKLYDTDTATMLHEASYGYNGDFDAWCEALYATKMGAYFISGWGGPRSHYVRYVSSDSYTGGKGLRPVTREEALEWLEEHGGNEVILKHFADLIEDA